RKLARVPNRVVVENAQAAIVERARAVAVVAEGREKREGGSGRIVLAAVDKQPIGGALVELLALLLGRGIGGGIRLLLLVFFLIVGRARCGRLGRRIQLDLGMDLI